MSTVWNATALNKCSQSVVHICHMLFSSLLKLCFHPSPPPKTQILTKHPIPASVSCQLTINWNLSSLWEIYKEKKSNLRKVFFFNTSRSGVLLPLLLKIDYWRIVWCAHEWDCSQACSAPGYWGIVWCIQEQVCAQTHTALNVEYDSKVLFDSLYLLTNNSTPGRCLGLKSEKFMAMWKLVVHWHHSYKHWELCILATWASSRKMLFRAELSYFLPTKLSYF